MAGDWIKMRIDLHDDPAVVTIAATCQLDEDTVVGKLLKLWGWADRHTVDGRTSGITPAWIDRFVAKKGFSEAMVTAGWLEIANSGVAFPEFGKHNGESAKKRADAALRQRLSRSDRDKGVTGVTRVATPRPFVRAVHERDGHICVYCGRPGSRRQPLGLDHLTPISRGGLDALENLVSCCGICNNEKNDRTVAEWGVEPKFLPETVKFDGKYVTVVCDRSVTRTEQSREEKRADHIDAVQRTEQSDITDQVDLIAAQLLSRLKYEGKDGGLIWRVAWLVNNGDISEHAARDAAESVANAEGPVAKPVGYFRATLEEHLGSGGATVLSKLLARAPAPPRRAQPS